MSEIESGITIIDPVPDRVLTGREKQIIKLLMSSYTMGEIGKKVGLGKTRLWEITSDPWFRQRLYEAETAAFSGTLALLSSQSRIFAETLIDVAQDTSEPGSTRISAARIALDKILALSEAFETNERIRSLERTLERLMEDLGQSF